MPIYNKDFDLKLFMFATRNGSLVVVAAGNSGLDLESEKNLIVTPAESGNAMAISAAAPLASAYGATNYSRFSSYSNFGNALVTVVALGGDFADSGNENCAVLVTRPCWVFDMVLNTVLGGTAAGSYRWAAVTSMAAPAAAAVAVAVAAVIKQRFPAATPAQLKTKLAQSVYDPGKVGQDALYGRGFVNALRAVTK